MAASLPAWLVELDGRVELSVRATPKAGRNEIAGERAGRLQVRVTAAPEDGKANAALCKLLAKRVGVGRTAVSVTRGETARDKTIAIAGVTGKEARDALAS